LLVSQEDEIPAATTLSRTALNTVFDETVAKVKELIQQQSPKTVGVTTDMWTDNYKRKSYMSVTLHFCSPEFQLHSLVLRTAVFSKAHTGVNIQAELEHVCEQFGLHDKKFVYVTDQGSNIVKACRLLGVERYGCMAHGLHNLIVVDGISKCAELQELIVKVKDAVKTFTYKTSFLEEEAAKMADEKHKAELENMMTTMEDDEQFSTCEVEGDDGDSDEEPAASSSTATDRKSSTCYRQQPLTTLKKDCPTRWNCLLLVLESVVKNQELIERCLGRLRLFDIMLSDDEWKIVENLVEFLSIFRSATEVLSGATYPTISLALLFRVEIATALTESPNDCLIVKSMKQRMRQRLDYRLPVREVHIVAAMLDPSQRNLNAVQEYLSERGMTAVDLLTQVIKQNLGDPASTAAQETAESSDANELHPWKKAKLELLSKHVVSAPSRALEIQQFRCLSVAPDNVLEWWESQQQTYPTLSRLARVILAIPATSAPSERVFSLAGLTINARRSSLAPSSVDKVLFVHENSSLV